LDFMRTRKPCVRRRRRLLGWNVRFIEGILGRKRRQETIARLM
jgi:hypothetical protein